VGDGGDPAAAGNAQALSGRTPWRRRGEEERGWWRWWQDLGSPAAAAPERRGGDGENTPLRLVEREFQVQYIGGSV
jgi:hypothetical protein